MNGLKSVLTDAAYVRVWMTGFCAGNAIWLETLVVGIYVIDLTGSPFFVALVVILRLSPFALFGTVIGAVAGRASPRVLLLIVLTVAALVALTVFLLLLIGYSRFWMLAAASLASGMVWAADMPLRRRILGDIIGTDRLRAAMSLDSATINGARMVGPLIGGLLYQRLGAIGAFARAWTVWTFCCATFQDLDGCDSVMRRHRRTAGSGRRATGATSEKGPSGPIASCH